ncbi:hypothetical protein SDRG_02374 [Saprolegnia diclina VS20]|uniref:Phospholipid/glycerol acyltransferase domain-containing protein n=1 Tax=Saprolegnia diclina (strain VS20) TaxID=1156394 RepID=T0SCG5_SAPDV|nr:hypothetical protein SDRG_02374 [Saprolegnia diclina VS20]EQC40482.1 hypothetical protein SDRG_02374 [Saprolegnia diclina VS20]|eukprot:XP_008606181.1 hypothetical protein SDRG_02374 [Saprolegnia diclina VS20]
MVDAIDRPLYHDVTKNPVYAFVYRHIYPLFVSFYAWTIIGAENIPTKKDARILFVGYHSNHNWDITLTGMSVRQIMDEVPVGLMHRTLVTCCPWLKAFGCIQGTRANALAAYERGHRACMVIPGGAEEALMGHENAYTVNWQSSKGHLRKGFAELAIEADAVIIPVVVENMQEMVFNPLFFLLNITYLSKLYDYLIALPGYIGWLFLQIKMWTWMWTAMLPVLPMPVKASVIFGKPLHQEKGESPEQYALRVSHEYARLMAATNPGGLNYSRALRARFAT